MDTPQTARGGGGEVSELLQLKEEQERRALSGRSRRSRSGRRCTLQSRFSLQQAQQQLEEVCRTAEGRRGREVRPGVEQVAGGGVSRGTGSGTFPGALSLRPYHHLTVWPLTNGFNLSELQVPHLRKGTGNCIAMKIKQDSTCYLIFSKH